MTRFTWGIVVGVLALVALAVGLAVVRSGAPAQPDLATPDGTTLAYALDFQQGDFDRAWDLLASEARAQTTKDRFIARAAGFRSNYERARLSTQDLRVDGDTARLDLVRSYSSSGGLFDFGSGSYSNRTAVRLVRQGGQWRISTPPDPFVLDSKTP